MAARNKTLASDLAEKLLTVLKAQRDHGAVAYPLTLARLAELTDPHAPAELVAKAVDTKPMKESAMVAGKKALSAPIALAEDLQVLAASQMLLEFALSAVCTPKKPTASISELKKKLVPKLQQPFQDAVQRRIQEHSLPVTIECFSDEKGQCLHPRHLPLLKKPDAVLAEDLHRVLMAQRQLGGAAYPLPFQKLLDLTNPTANAALLKKALAHPILKDKIALVDAKNKEAPVALSEDRIQLASSNVLLEYLVRAKRKSTEHSFPIDSLLKKTAALHQSFVQAVNRRIEDGSLTAGIGWMWISKRRHVFFLDDVHQSQLRANGAASTTASTKVVAPPVAQASTVDFAQAFDEAFRQLDRQGGSHNFVSLVDLRQRLALARGTFDAELRKLRVAGRFTLSAAEGRHGITPEERDAAIVEDGSHLLYVSRKMQ